MDFIIYVHLSERFCFVLQTPDRQEIRNEPNKSFRQLGIHKPSQGESVEGLIPPHYAHFHDLNAEYGQKAYTSQVYTHFLRRYPHLCLICFTILKGFAPQPPQTTNSSCRFLIPPQRTSEWVYIRRQMLDDMFLSEQTQIVGEGISLSHPSVFVQRLFPPVSLLCN